MLAPVIGDQLQQREGLIGGILLEVQVPRQLRLVVLPRVSIAPELLCFCWSSLQASETGFEYALFESAARNTLRATQADKSCLSFRSTPFVSLLLLPESGQAPPARAPAPQSPSALQSCVRACVRACYCACVLLCALLRTIM